MILEWLLSSPQIRELGAAIRFALVFSGGFLLIIGLLEFSSGGDISRYRTRNFLNDCVYTLFYTGGVYRILFYAPLAAVLQGRLSAFELDLLQDFPATLAFVTYFLILDFLGYWLHRLQHRSRFLWAFHRVHHAQTILTFLTTNRIHVVEQFIANLVMFVPTLVLGVPPSVWAPVIIMQFFFEFVQHSELAWGFGPLRRILVSPTFHAVHHSPRPQEHDGNYGKILSVWDFVFGTAVVTKRPKSYGVSGEAVPETMWGQFVTPFKMLLGKV